MEPRPPLNALCEEQSHDAHSVGRCHVTAPSLWRVRMTAALASAVDALGLPASPGVSHRAVRSVLRYMARIAFEAGEFRWGLGTTKVSERTDYSPATVKRARAFLVAHGLVERVQAGGGRSSTHWRICVERLRPASRSGSPAGVSGQPDRPEPGQGHQHKVVRQWDSRKLRRPHPAADPPATRPFRAGVPLWLCEHGGEEGALPDGQPRCPLAPSRYSSPYGTCETDLWS